MSKQSYSHYIRPQPQDRKGSHYGVAPSSNGRGRSISRNREERRGRSCDFYERNQINYDRNMNNGSREYHYNRSRGRGQMPPSYSHRSRSCDPRPRAYPSHHTQQSNSSKTRKRHHSSDPNQRKYPNNDRFDQPHHHDSGRGRGDGLKGIHHDNDAWKDASYVNNRPLAPSRSIEADMYQDPSKRSKHDNFFHFTKENRLNTYQSYNYNHEKRYNGEQRSRLHHSSTSSEPHRHLLTSRKDLSSRTQFQQRSKVPHFGTIHNAHDLIWTAHDNLAILTPASTAAFWNKLSKQMSGGGGNTTNIHQPNHHDDLSQCLHKILEHTESKLGQFGGIDLCQTIYSMAKLTCTLRENGKQNISDVARGCFLTSDMSLKKDIFRSLAFASKNSLFRFVARGLSNLAYSYALIGYVPKFGDESDLFDLIATYAAECITKFNSQDLANLVWAYGKTGVRHSKLFEKVANHIVASNCLKQFNAQDLANTVWAYAKTGVRHQKLFGMVADHIVASKILDQFNSQNLSNTVWAYATAGEFHPTLFEKMANHIVASNNFDRFNSQALANLVWAFATAGIYYPKLFEKMANHIVASNSLDRFNSQALANVAWAYATMGISNKHLFSTIALTASKLIDSFNAHDLANTAWSYAVVGVNAPTLFNNHFIATCVEKMSKFSVEGLSQLHQWNLWQMYEMSRDGLPEALVKSCFEAFVSEDTTESRLQKTVVAQLSAIGLDPEEEKRVVSGYSIDAVVKVDGRTVGVEVDGPSHFIGRSKFPAGRTILKRRQVPSIDGIELVSVPYWEWDELDSDERKERYLRELLGVT